MYLECKRFFIDDNAWKQILYSKLAEVWLKELKDERGMEDQEERMKKRNIEVSKCFHLISYKNIKILYLIKINY